MTHLPPFDGATGWLNSEPLGPGDLRGHVVVVNFWTFTCINWLRQLPYVRAWSRAYRDDGLIVVGVHTPELTFEQDVDGVRRATAERDIDYPVAVDSDYAVWSAFANHYWPALYTADGDGVIRDYHPGEGQYEQYERVIQRLLGVERDLVARTVTGTGVEAPADWPHLRSPETYLGYDRGDRLASPGGPRVDRRHTYELPRKLRTNHWALVGSWTIEGEKAVLDEAPGTIAYRMQARDAHMVLAPGQAEPIPFRVRLDGEAPGADHGLDVDEDGHGLLRAGGVLQLVRQAGEVRKRTLEVELLAPGAEAYIFTFG